MRTCQSCGRENPDDRDFCECGEYLRWDPTGVVQAVTPDMVQKAAEESPPSAPEPPKPAPAPAPPPPPAAITPAAPPPAPPENGHGAVETPASAPKTAVQPAVPQQPAQQEAVEAEAAGAAITLRSPDRDAPQGETLAVGVEPGQRERVVGLVRNQSGIVDNYELRVDGLPDGWWTVFPDTVYLVPFGAGGTYEQEVEVHLHPPRSPDAAARIWNLRLTAHSKAHGREAAAAPLQLAIQPYTETGTRVRPERVKGRRRADFDVAVENKANAPVLVALEGSDPDGELEFGFNRPPTEIPPGEAINTTMRVKPPRQIWLGRPAERRLEVNTLTGEAAQERLAAEPVSAEELQQADGAAPPKRGLFGRGGGAVPGFYGPKVFKPQVQEPGLQIGPGGINIRQPKLRAPKVQAPKMKQANLKLSSLKMPGGGGAAAPAAPLLPTQAVFRQKPWLPWWLLPVGIALAAIAAILYLMLPRSVVVPDVVGSATAFEAEQVLTEAELRLAPQLKEEVSTEEEPGTVLEQTPEAGESVEKDSEVTLLVAIGAGDATVPNIVGLTPSKADEALREEKLSLGQASPQPIDPEGKIESQIPAAEEVVPEGTPVNIFFPEPGDGAGGGGGGGGGEEKGEEKAEDGGGGGGAPKDVVVPAVAGAAAVAFAKTASDAGLLPETRKEFHPSKPGTLFGTDPPAGGNLKEGDKITLLVSAGFPKLVFDNEKDILRINGANGTNLDPVADGPQIQQDPTFSHDGKNVAFIGGRQVFLADLTKPKAAPIPLTQDTDQFLDPAWAPTTDANVLALARLQGDDRDLCLGRIRGDGIKGLDCKTEPKHLITSAIRWAPEGKEILATGIAAETGAFGIVRWRSKKAFSPDIDDWSRGRFETDISQVGEGVIDAAISADGKRMAAVVKTGNNPFRLVLAERDDFALANAKPTGVRACKVIWRPDGRALAVVQADRFCAESTGSLGTLPVDNPARFRLLDASGDNPVFEPLSLEG